MKKFDKSSSIKVICFGFNLRSKIPGTDVIELKVDEVTYLNYLHPDIILVNGVSYFDLIKSFGFYKVIDVSKLSESDIRKYIIEMILTRDDSLISVYTSTYNIGDRILDTYYSLNNQSYNNWEWVIVDDSNDRGVTWSTLESIAKIDNRVKIYQFSKRTNGIIGEAKFRASSLCNGVVLVELDHDDLLTNDCLELIWKGYISHPECGFYYSDVCEYDFVNKYSYTYPDGFSFGFGFHYETTINGVRYLPYNGIPINEITIRHIVGVPNHVRAWRSDVFHKIGGYNRLLRIADDYELILRTFLETKFLYIPKLLYIQSMGNGNSQDSNGNRSDIQIKVEYIREFYEDKLTDRLIELGVSEPRFGGLSTDELLSRYQSTKVRQLNEVLKITD